MDVGSALERQGKIVKAPSKLDVGRWSVIGGVAMNIPRSYGHPSNCRVTPYACDDVVIDMWNF